MRNSIKIFILCILILLGMTIWDFGERESALNIMKVEGSLDSSRFEPVIAGQVNEKATYYSINQKIKKAGLYMKEDRQIYIAEDELSEALLCAVHFYEEERLQIMRKDICLEIRKGVDGIRKGSETISCREPLLRRNDEYYVNLSAIADLFGFSLKWDYGANMAVLTEGEAVALPARYDLRDYQAVPVARNQGKLSTCWAFASLNALETTLWPEDTMSLSVDHMSMQNSFGLTQQNGGEYTMAIAYLTAWQGPVLEQDDPYADGETTAGLLPQKHVQEVQVIEEKNYEKIKEAVYKYGGVQSSLYTSLTSSTSKSVYYNSEKYAYCFIGEDKPNHDIVIIGWDDNYPKENFNSPLEGDGAFICLNSWGPRFGEKGIFYVSYYDTNIGIHNVVYTKAEPPDNFDFLYQSDLCGWVGNLGYGEETAFFANAYTAAEDTSLEAVGFYATGKNTSYKLYFVSNFVDKNSLNERTLVAEGSFENAGYYTVDLDQSQAVKAGERFAFIVEIETPGSIHPIAVEFVSEEDPATRNVDLSDGEGYISYRGKVWNSSETEQNCNVCLKVYGKRLVT